MDGKMHLDVVYNHKNCNHCLMFKQMNLIMFLLDMLEDKNKLTMLAFVCGEWGKARYLMY